MVDYNNLSAEEREQLKKQFGLTDDELDAYINDANVQSEDSPNNIPMPGARDDILKFLRDVFKIKKDEHLSMNRTGNLGQSELGNLTYGVRKYNDIANYAEIAGYKGFAEYSRNKTSNVITTSTSKKGFFLQLITTQKQIRKTMGDKTVTKKSSIWGGSEETVKGGEEE
ncbi:MAG TPA: hypothetical protein PLT65_04385 [Bacilli bacterium]|nr:hypothetical protein [Bacilli bacterium]